VIITWARDDHGGGKAGEGWTSEDCYDGWPSRANVGSQRYDLERSWARWTFVWWRASARGVELLDTFCSPIYRVVWSGKAADEVPMERQWHGMGRDGRLYYPARQARTSGTVRASAQSPMQLISAHFRAALRALRRLIICDSGVRWEDADTPHDSVDTVTNNRHLYCLHVSRQLHTQCQWQIGAWQHFLFILNAIMPKQSQPIRHGMFAI